MTNTLSARLSDPAPSLTLSDHLSDPNRLTLANRLGVEDYMEIDQASEVPSPGNFNLPGGQLTRNMRDANALYQHPVMGESMSVHNALDEEDMDDIKEGKLGYKKMKRGRCSRHKIQGYWRRDKEREEWKRRRQGRH